MPSTRSTVRLPAPLDAAVQEYLRTTGTSFAVLIRQDLAASLADTRPTEGRYMHATQSWRCTTDYFLRKGGP
jgi:hypothetical protein